MTETHVSAVLIASYVRGEAIPVDQQWFLEAHLEGCAHCRARIAELATDPEPGAETGLSTVVDEVWSRIAPRLGATVPARRGRLRLARWLSPAMLPWLAGALLLTALAVSAAALLGPRSGSPLVLMLSPVVPVLGVAAVWAKGLDPVHELIASTPRAGLYLVLRRTASVLAIVVPVLLVGGWLTGTSPALWLLPCLGCTVATLALGSALGVDRAAVVVTAVWAGLIALPSLAVNRLTFTVAVANPAVWAAVIVLGAAVVALRARSFSRA